MATQKLKVTLERPHTHAGIQYAVGATLEVSEQEAQFLLQANVIRKKPASSAQNQRKETENV
ncbi:hypothetical protein VQ643_04340 [Pseudomonas sp. F1_0610]|uniref:DUF7210 family protein n=1 Tax=Pseudomonas sp. F1_0610 TaxID=3114284 RepID=UPI0039C0157C